MLSRQVPRVTAASKSLVPEVFLKVLVSAQRRGFLDPVAILIREPDRDRFTRTHAPQVHWKTMKLTILCTYRVFYRLKHSMHAAFRQIPIEIL